MDMELRRMQDQANSFCNVELRRISPCKKPSPLQDDGMLLLGLILILAMDGGDTTLMLMLLYIFL